MTSKQSTETQPANETVETPVETAVETQKGSDLASLAGDVESPSPANQTAVTVEGEIEKSKTIAAQKRPTLKQMLRFARNYSIHDIGYISSVKREKLRTVAFQMTTSQQVISNPS